MYHNVYAMGLLPDEQGDLDGWTNMLQELEEALLSQFDTANVELETDEDRVRLYMSLNDDARKIHAQLADFELVGDDEVGGWEFRFETVEVD